MTDILRLQDLHIGFSVPGGTLEAVRGVSIRVPAGKTVAVVGESGTGKSVLSQAVMGILPNNGRVNGGRILFCDPDKPGSTVDLAKMATEGPDYRAIRGGRISMIFQEPMTSLSPLHTIGNQIVEAVRLHRPAGPAEAQELAREMLRLVGFPNPARALKTYPFELSGGLRQRAMIAMALVCRPALLIADEPTTALDVTIQAQILKLMLDLQAELGMAILIITHDLGIVANVADEVVVMYRGEVMESGPMASIFANPGHPYLKALLRAVPRFDMGHERLMPIREIRHGDGHMLAERKRVWTKEAEAAGPLLTVKDISKSFAIRNSGLFGGERESIKAVDDVSFTIRRGECLGLVGESGCGKTTLSKILMRALTPDAGTIRFNDHGKPVDVAKLEGEDLKAFRPNMQFIFQDPFSSLNPRMTVFDILTEPLTIHGIGTPAERKAIAKELMGLVGLDIRYLQRYPHSFSGGQRQRIGIARALALRPDLIICDEPVSALDVSIQAQILNLLKDLKAKLGLTYLFISHNLAVVDYIADRIMVMCRGQVVEMAPRAALFARPTHPYTRALLAAVPAPDPSRRLDFTALMDGRASDPAAWPAPFTLLPDTVSRLVEVERGHFIRATEELAMEMAS